MKILFFYNPITRKKWFLNIDNQYECDRMIVPLGADCHPAYVLQYLHLRKTSLPFDWLNNNHALSLFYVNKNIDEDFKNFIHELRKNENGHVVAKSFPYCEFMHEPNLILSSHDRNKLKRRIKRFKTVFLMDNIHFINAVHSKNFKNDEDVDVYIRNVKRFKNRINLSQDLSVYIIFDESENENIRNVRQIIKALKQLNIKYGKFIKNDKAYPTWGNPENFPKLLKSIGLNLWYRKKKIYINSSLR